jgi:hypothetical protein
VKLALSPMTRFVTWLRARRPGCGSDHHSEECLAGWFLGRAARADDSNTNTAPLSQRAAHRASLERTHELLTRLAGRAPTLCRPPDRRIDSVGLAVCASLPYEVML